MFTPTVGRIGFCAGLVAFTATVAFDAVQLLQILRIVSFPADEILIFGTSLCIVLPFIFETLAFHYSCPADKRFWTHAALTFTTMYAVFATSNYVVQLTTVIPAKVRGAADPVRILEQTPHSLFWDLDAVAYTTMGLTTLVIIPALRTSGVEAWLRIVCVANVVATVLAGIVYFYPAYSYKLLLLGVPWGITAPAFMLLLGIALRRRGAELSSLVVESALQYADSVTSACRTTRDSFERAGVTARRRAFEPGGAHSNRLYTTAALLFVSHVPQREHESKQHAEEQQPPDSEPQGIAPSPWFGNHRHRLLRSFVNID